MNIAAKAAIHLWHWVIQRALPNHSCNSNELNVAVYGVFSSRFRSSQRHVAVHHEFDAS